MIVVEEKDRPVEGYPNKYAAIPPNGLKCEWTGLGHAHLYQALLHGSMKGKVRVVNIKEPGAKRGKTLFHVGDMLRLLDGLANPAPTQEANDVR